MYTMYVSGVVVFYTKTTFKTCIQMGRRYYNTSVFQIYRYLSPVFGQVNREYMLCSASVFGVEKLNEEMEFEYFTRFRSFSLLPM